MLDFAKMMNLEVLTNNPYQENTYILWDETKECVIIDPGMYTADEQNAVVNYIKDNNLKLKNFPYHLLDPSARTYGQFLRNYSHIIVPIICQVDSADERSRLFSGTYSHANNYCAAFILFFHFLFISNIVPFLYFHF